MEFSMRNISRLQYKLDQNSMDNTSTDLATIKNNIESRLQNPDLNQRERAELSNVRMRLDNYVEEAKDLPIAIKQKNEVIESQKIAKEVDAIVQKYSDARPNPDEEEPDIYEDEHETTYIPDFIFAIVGRKTNTGKIIAILILFIIIVLMIVILVNFYAKKNMSASV